MTDVFIAIELLRFFLLKAIRNSIYVRWSWSAKTTELIAFHTTHNDILLLFDVRRCTLWHISPPTRSARIAISIQLRFYTIACVVVLVCMCDSARLIFTLSVFFAYVVSSSHSHATNCIFGAMRTDTKPLELEHRWSHMSACTITCTQTHTIQFATLSKRAPTSSCGCNHNPTHFPHMTPPESCTPSPLHAKFGSKHMQ